MPPRDTPTSGWGLISRVNRSETDMPHADTKDSGSQRPEIGSAPYVRGVRESLRFP